MLSTIALLALCATTAMAHETDSPALFPVPRLTSIPSHPNATWMEDVRTMPKQFGITGVESTSGSVYYTGFSYMISFATVYPLVTVDAEKLIEKYRHTWQAPRILQSFNLTLWTEDARGDIKQESPWIKAGLLTWSRSSILFDCAEKGAGFRLYNEYFDARSNKRLDKQVMNEAFDKDSYIDRNFWLETCRR